MIEPVDINNVKLMINYAVHKGTELPLNILDDVVAADLALATHAVPQEIESKFWNSSTEISKTIQPVTVESIQCSLFSSTGKKTEGARSSRRYMVGGVVIFVILLCLQLYWFVVDSVFENLKQTQSALQPYVALHDSVRWKYRDKKEEDIQSAITEAYAKSAEDATSSSTLSAENKTKPRIFSANEFTQLESLLRENLNALARTTGWATGIVYPESKENFTYFYVITSNDLRYIQGAQVIIDVFNRFLLPVAYGLLGAFVFTVRDLADSVRKVLYTTEANVVYNFRLFVGGVAGLAIAWFVVPKAVNFQSGSTDTGSVLSSLSPLALSFVAGYAVEILISIIDRVVSAFTTTQTSRP
jgi:hypothetical protein